MRQTKHPNCPESLKQMNSWAWNQKSSLLFFQLLHFKVLKSSNSAGSSVFGRTSSSTFVSLGIKNISNHLKRVELETSKRTYSNSCVVEPAKFRWFLKIQKKAFAEIAKTVVRKLRISVSNWNMAIGFFQISCLRSM